MEDLKSDMDKILVLCDDRWHPAEIVEKGLELLKTQGYQFDIIKDAKSMFTSKMLSEYSIVLCSKSNNISAENMEPWFEEGVTKVGPKEFKTFVENGGMFLAVHSGAAFSETSWRQEERFRRPCMEYVDFFGLYISRTSKDLSCRGSCNKSIPSIRKRGRGFYRV